ncbi:hypothetical protein Fmac_009681 [Flemingia macrophylla]|uniref:Cullin N-terminal domain-containing protein n=1 Tax=Flemingia macrophylla TaxID=520843 RepID=A0ABD1N0X9_9FABA
MSNQKKRNFQIEAFKHRVVMDPKYADKTWKILEHAIHEFYNHNASGLSFEELYRCCAHMPKLICCTIFWYWGSEAIYDYDVATNCSCKALFVSGSHYVIINLVGCTINAYNMVLHKFGEKLYSGLVSTMTGHLKDIAQSVEAAQGGSFLEDLNRKWNDHNKALQMIRDILMYMDRTYIPSTQKTSVHELGPNLWKENVIYSSQIRTRLSNTLLELLHSEHTSEVIDRGILRNITKMLMDLGPSVHGQEFENHFLQVSAEFYCVESQKFIECCDCGDYLKKAESLLNEETERVSHYLDSRTEKKITNVVEKEMIENHMLRLIHMENSGLVHMLCDDKYEDLSRMYNLSGRVTDGLSKIREVMTSHMRESGKQLVTDLERLKDPVEYVQRLLDEKDKQDRKLGIQQ